MSSRTEDVNPRYAQLDTWPMQDAIDAMYEGQLVAIVAVREALPSICSAVDRIAATLGERGKLVYVGAGTSGRLAVLDGVELGPTFGWPADRLDYCLAGGDTALTESAEGAEDDQQDGAAQIEAAGIGPGDVVIGVAASGQTPFTIAALATAKRRGALTVGIANNKDSDLLAVADCPILAQTGSEVVAGSTRMKAGTAQKAVLNILSTAVMLSLGKVHQGYMVDMVVSNEKLERRAAVIVSEIAGVDAGQAREALELSGNNIKQAVLVCKGKSPAESDVFLAAAGGNLRAALEAVSE